MWTKRGTDALFISSLGNHISFNALDMAVIKTAKRAGLHNPCDLFSSHCCKYWFTTNLRRDGMPSDFIQEPRDDVRREAIDVCDHIAKKS